MPPPSAAAGPRVATGGAAILARLRAQRATKSPAAPPTKELVVLYASQTGTASEIAKNIQAEAEQKGVKGRVREHLIRAAQLHTELRACLWPLKSRTSCHCVVYSRPRVPHNMHSSPLSLPTFPHSYRWHP